MIRLPIFPAWARPPSRLLPQPGPQHQLSEHLLLLPMTAVTRNRIPRFSRHLDGAVSQYGGLRDNNISNNVMSPKPQLVEANIRNLSSNQQTVERPRPGLLHKPDLNPDSSSRIVLPRRLLEKWRISILAQTCFPQRSVSIRSSVSFRGKVAKTAS